MKKNLPIKIEKGIKIIHGRDYCKRLCNNLKLGDSFFTKNLTLLRSILHYARVNKKFCICRKQKDGYRIWRVNKTAYSKSKYSRYCKDYRELRVGKSMLVKSKGEVSCIRIYAKRVNKKFISEAVSGKHVVTRIK